MNFINYIKYGICIIAIPIFTFTSCKTPKNHEGKAKDLTGINVSIVDSFDVFSNVSSLKYLFDTPGCGTSRRLITPYSTEKSDIVVYYEQVNNTIAYYDNKKDSTSIIELDSYMVAEKENHPESEFDLVSICIINPDTQLLFTHKSIHLVVNKNIVKSNYVGMPNTDIIFCIHFNHLNRQGYVSPSSVIITLIHNLPHKGKNEDDKDFLALVDVNTLEIKILDYLISEIVDNDEKSSIYTNVMNYSQINNEPYLRYGADSILTNCISKEKRILKGIEKSSTQRDFKSDYNDTWNFLFDVYTKSASSIYYHKDLDLYFYVTFGIDTVRVNPKSKRTSTDFNCAIHIFNNELNYVKRIQLEDKRLLPDEINFSNNRLYIKCKGIGTKQNILSNKEIVSTLKVFEFYNEN
jgi:hypothetical protein